jgi:YVTN family beta-propeller protein
VQSRGKIHHIFPLIIIILGILLLTFVVVIPSNAAYAQNLLNTTLLPDRTSLYDRTIHAMTDETLRENSPQIEVGSGPVDIAVHGDTIYVANFISDTISILSIESGLGIKHIADISANSAPTDLYIYEPNSALYVANRGSDTVSVISTDNHTWISEISVGDGPMAMAADQFSGNLYVANSLNNTISVISIENNTKIGEDIPVGFLPVAIAVNPVTDTIYVANYGFDSVSVINATTNEPVINAMTNEPLKIPVGERPVAMAVNPVTNTIYVVNAESDTISVISGENNMKIDDIPVTRGPSGVVFDQFRNAIYVANFGSDGISIIEPRTNNVQAGIMFKVEPFNSGVVKCGNLSTFAAADPFAAADQIPPLPTGQLRYVDFGLNCIAVPEEGFEFDSWVENLEDNSTQLVRGSDSISTWDVIGRDMTLGLKTLKNEPESFLNVERFGTFTANFKELPAALPAETVLNQYSTIGLALLSGLLIPSLIGWNKSRKEIKQLDYYHQQITSLYEDGKLDEDDRERLDKLRSDIVDAYSKGKINDRHHDNLKYEVSVLYDKIFKKRINDLPNNDAENETRKERLERIRKDLDDAYSEGRIDDKHYKLLNNDISKLDGREDAS